MPESCTCGAQLPPDARFCHICGKPQRPEDVAALTALAAEETPPPPPPAIEAPALNFRNPIAVRVALLMASSAALLCWLFIFGFVIWLPASGMLAVHLYHRRTGQPLSVRAGARMGLMTGTFVFVIMTVLFILGTVAVAYSGGGLASAYQQQLHNMQIHDPNLEQTLKLLQSPAGLFTVFLFGLSFLFSIVMSFCTAGGALGAKLVGHR